jgi:hypothetical protein
MPTPKKKTARGASGARKKGAPVPRQRSKPDWAERFLGCVAETANIKAACKLVKVGRRTVYHRKKADPVFAQDLAEALEDAADRLEREAWRRAVEGVERPVFGSGGKGVGTVEVGTVREYSDTLLIFLLKAHRPEKFRDRHEVRHAGRVETGDKWDLTKLSDEQLVQLEELASIAGAEGRPRLELHEVVITTREEAQEAMAAMPLHEHRRLRAEADAELAEWRRQRAQDWAEPVP